MRPHFRFEDLEIWQLAKPLRLSFIGWRSNWTGGVFIATRNN